MKRALLLCCTLALTSAPAFAGYLITSTQVDLDSGETTPSQMLVDGPNLRAKMEGGQEMIFLGREQKMLNIMHDQRQVMEMNTDSMGAMANQLSAAMQALQEQMADMPPEQRAMMEKMMGSQMPQGPSATAEAAPPSYDITDTGETEDVEGITCRKHVLMQEGRKTGEILVAPWSAVEAGPDAVEAMSAMGKFMEEMMSNMSGPFAAQLKSHDFPDLSRVNGYPMVIRQIENGRVKMETRNAKPVKRDVPPEAFEPPAGYQVVDPSKMMGGGL